MATDIESLAQTHSDLNAIAELAARLLAVAAWLILFVLIIVAAALDGWRVTLDFNKYSEGVVELVVIICVLAFLTAQIIHVDV